MSATIGNSGASSPENFRSDEASVCRAYETCVARRSPDHVSAAVKIEVRDGEHLCKQG